MKKQTRMIMLALTVFSLVAVVLAGCGNGSDAADKSAEPEGGAHTEAAAKTRIVQTVNGEVEIPADPQRIVATYYVGELAALGIKPVGTISRLLGDKSPNLAPYTEGVADIGEQPNLEAILNLNPDLIITFDLGNTPYEEYSKIAPTVMIPWSDDDVWSKLRTVAEIVNRQEEAENFIRAYEEKAAAAKEAIKGHIGQEETVAVMSFYDKSIGLFGARDIGHALYEGLGLTPMPLTKAKMDADPNFTSDWSISVEHLPEFTADRIFLAVQEGATSYNDLKEMALWKELPAVKNNKVYELPVEIWFQYDPISVSVALDEAVRLLTGE